MLTKSSTSEPGLRYFHIKDFALDLVFKNTLKSTRNWSVGMEHLDYIKKFNDKIECQIFLKGKFSGAGFNALVANFASGFPQTSGYFLGKLVVSEVFQQFSGI